MDYGMLTPEINSARMYLGAGSGPLMAAAAAWDGLAAELHSAAASYGSVVSGLTTEWSGPSSASMAAAAAPYMAWMTTTATQAQQAATQAKAAAGAYEAAFAMTVPPPVVAANRSLLTSLVATNVLGQNTPAIAATEAHYGEMWAQDAAAMYGYAGASAAATKVTPFTPPKQTTNLAGQAAQSAAVAQTTGTSAATNAQATVSQVTSAVPSALRQLASPAASTSASPLAALSSGLGLQPGDITNGATNLMSSTLSPMSVAGITQVGSDLAVINSLSGAGGLGTAGLGPITTGATAGALGSVGSTALGGSAVSAGLGTATPVGALSVPSSWAAATPASVTSAATALPGSSFSAIPANGAAGMPGMPMGGMGGMGGRFGGTGPRYGFKPIVMARPPAAGYGPIAL